MVYEYDKEKRERIDLKFKTPVDMDELQTQLKNNTNVDQDLLDLLTCLYELNFVLIETETKNYASKYNMQVQELYSKMKSDLFDILEM